MSRFYRWVHRACTEHLVELARDRDRIESLLFRAQKQHDDLMTAYKELVEQSVARIQFPNVEHLFSEEPAPDEKKSFLTPPWEEREGLTVE